MISLLSRVFSLIFLFRLNMHLKDLKKCSELVVYLLFEVFTLTNKVVHLDSLKK